MQLKKPNRYWICSLLLILSACTIIPDQALSRRSFFYVGGSYVGSPDKEVMQGQMYVEKLEPLQVKQPYPLVLIHGAAQTATNWMMTPDGRKGWAEYFLELGYVVYMVDQPLTAQPELTGFAPDGERAPKSVLRHRIVVGFAAESEGVTPDAIIHRIVENTPVREDELTRDPRFQTIFAS